MCDVFEGDSTDDMAVVIAMTAGQAIEMMRVVAGKDDVEPAFVAFDGMVRAGVEREQEMRAARKEMSA